MDFELPAELTQRLAELDDFIERESRLGDPLGPPRGGRPGAARRGPRGGDRPARGANPRYFAQPT